MIPMYFFNTTVVFFIALAAFIVVDFTMGLLFAAVNPVEDWIRIRWSRFKRLQKRYKS